MNFHVLPWHLTLTGLQSPTHEFLFSPDIHGPYPAPVSQISQISQISQTPVLNLIGFISFIQPTIIQTRKPWFCRNQWASHPPVTTERFSHCSCWFRLLPEQAPSGAVWSPVSSSLRLWVHVNHKLPPVSSVHGWVSRVWPSCVF